MKTEGNLTSCTQNRTRRGRIATNFGPALLVDLATVREIIVSKPRAGEEDVRRHKVGGHTDELAGASM